MPQNVLSEDWENYDNRKIRDGRDRSKFSCDEPWEVNYLVEKISKHVFFKTDTAIRSAIESCCREGASRVRESFVQCVMAKLK